MCEAVGRVELHFVFSGYYFSVYPLLYEEQVASYLPSLSNLISHFSLPLLPFKLSDLNFLSPVLHF